jgi:hypothetical protein
VHLNDRISMGQNSISQTVKFIIKKKQSLSQVCHSAKLQIIKQIYKFLIKSTKFFYFDLPEDPAFSTAFSGWTIFQPLIKMIGKAKTVF